MGHAEHDLLHAELAAALDDLLERRHGGFAAVEAEALGAEEAQRRELLEAFALDQLVEDRLLAFRREHDFLVRTFDAALEPVLLLRVVDVHELVADAAGIGALQDVGHLARRRGLQAHHAVHVDRAVHVLGVEAVERRLQLRMRHLRRDVQRIEIGFEMADDAIGAHELDGADGFLRRLVQVGLTDGALLLRPLAGERADKLAVFELGFPVAPPRRAAADLGRIELGLAQACEVFTPCWIDGVGIFEILGVERLHEGGIGAGQEGGRFQDLVGGPGDSVGWILACHFNSLRRGFLGPTVSICGLEPEGEACSAVGASIQRFSALNMGSMRPDCDGRWR